MFRGDKKYGRYKRRTDCWISPEELHETAVQNLLKEEYYIRDLNSIFKELTTSPGTIQRQMVSLPKEGMHTDGQIVDYLIQAAVCHNAAAHIV